MYGNQALKLVGRTQCPIVTITASDFSAFCQLSDLSYEKRRNVAGTRLIAKKKLKTHFTDHHLPKPKVSNSYKNLRLHKTHKSALTSFWLRVGVVAPAVSFRLYLTLMKRRVTPICTSCCKRLWLIQCSINGYKVHCLLFTVYLFTYAYCVFTQHFMFNLFHLSP